MKIAKQEVTLIKYSGGDLDTVNAARVSFNKESTELSDKDIKLINYLAKHNHFTPFCHNSLTFRVKAPVFVARQLHKHVVGGIINEVSRRYVDYEPECFLPNELRSRPESSIKQGSVGVHPLSKHYLDRLALSYESNLELYNDMIEDGIAPEQARMVLPLNTMTEWWWTGSLMFFARVYNQRNHESAQKESQEIAQALGQSIPTSFRHSWEALTGKVS